MIKTGLLQDKTNGSFIRTQSYGIGKKLLISAAAVTTVAAAAGLFGISGGLAGAAAFGIAYAAASCCKRKPTLPTRDPFLARQDAIWQSFKDSTTGRRDYPPVTRLSDAESDSDDN